MDSAVAGIKITHVLASTSASGRMANVTNYSTQQALPSTRFEMLAFHASSRSLCGVLQTHRRDPCVSARNGGLCITRCSMKPGIDSNSPKNKNPAIDLGSSSKTQHVAAPPPNPDLASTCSRGLVLGLGPASAWDGAEIGSPVVKRFIGDNEERWYMWYHGRCDGEGARESVGLATSSNGIHWARGQENVRPCGDAGMVMDCRTNWWAFDTESVRPSEMVIMSSPMYSAVYWLYYTGFSSEEVELSGESSASLSNAEKFLQEEYGVKGHGGGRILRSLPGLACSQDGRHWARIEGDHHSGALLDVGTGKEWDSLFIASPQVMMHSHEDMRMYYYSFDRENGHFAVGVARSRDGIRWVKCGKIMGAGSDGAFDELGVKNPYVVRNEKEGNYLMAYEGVAADGKRSIGMAVSDDGLKNWKRIQEEPVLEPSEEDGWDNRGVGSPCLVQTESQVDKWRLYYAGLGQGGQTGIGMATSEGGNTRRFRRWSGMSM